MCTEYNPYSYTCVASCFGLRLWLIPAYKKFGLSPCSWNILSSICTVSPFIQDFGFCNNTLAIGHCFSIELFTPNINFHSSTIVKRRLNGVGIPCGSNKNTHTNCGTSRTYRIRTRIYTIACGSESEQQDFKCLFLRHINIVFVNNNNFLLCQRIICSRLDRPAFDLCVSYQNIYIYIYVTCVCHPLKDTCF